MRVESIHIHKYHNIRDISIPLSTTGSLPCDRFYIMGGNASGKTSVLQAIALPLALATRKISEVDQFMWGGGHVLHDLCNDGTHIELDISFSNAELLAINDVADMWHRVEGLPYYIEPGDSNMVRLIMDCGSLYSQSASYLHQFLGPYYMSRYMSGVGHDLPHEFGGVLWLDNSISPSFPMEMFLPLHTGQEFNGMDRLSDGESRVIQILSLVGAAPRGSIILIDDIDLHLDPATAQDVIRKIYKLAPQCQVIMSTHSEAISNMTPEYAIHRLEPCYI